MSKRFENFGKVMKEIRADHKLTQVQIADMVGIHAQFWSNAERQICALPKPAMANLVKKLKLTASERQTILGALISDEMNHTREVWSKTLRVGG